MDYHESFTLRVGDQEFLANRDNTFLFTFAGHLACYNHVFHVLEEDEEANVNKGVFIFSMNPGWQELTDYMFEQSYPMHLNMREVSPNDRDAFDRTMLADLREMDGLPPEWEDGATE